MVQPPRDAHPPLAHVRLGTRSASNPSIDDPYAWMRRVDDPELLTYLAAENDWCTGQTASLEEVRSELERELAAALPDDDVSAPWRHGAFEHRTRRPAGQQYAVHVRTPVDPVPVSLVPETAPPAEQVLLDENVLADGHDFLELGVCEPSPDGRLLAYSVDLDGSEVYTLRFRDLASGADLLDEVPGTYYGLGWAADGGSVLYTTLDDAYRPDTVRRHVLGTQAADDTVVWHEPDRRFELEIEPTRSGDLLRLSAHSRDTTEVRLVPTADLSAPPVLVAARVPAVEYAVDHRPGPDGGDLVIVTDLDAPEYRIMTVPLATPAAEHWVELVAHDPDVRVEAGHVVGVHVVVEERSGGVARVRILSAAGGTVRLVAPDGAGEQVRVARQGQLAPGASSAGSPESSVRLVREGWVRPPTTVDHDLATGTELVVHEQQVLRSMDGLRCQMVQAVAEDGVRVPISLVRREPAGGSLTDSGPAPCLLYGYGAYEASLDPEFWPDMLPLLDRGVVLAVAHVRGGGELGRGWWQQGRLMRKRTTFTDFVSCARHLVETGVTAADRLAARGMSAGGLLMGAVAQLAPEDFALIVAEVPFVDVVTTMLDDTLPLTVAEWEEWGDPRFPEQADYLSSYSPYDRTPGPQRPALLVTASLHDPRVSVHEPAKWVARIRAEEETVPSARSAALLMRTALGGGAHSGPAGRYDAWAHEAFLHAVTLAHITPKPSSGSVALTQDPHE